MFKNERGSGVVVLLLTVAVLIGIAYYALKLQTSAQKTERAAAVQSQQIEKQVQEQLQKANEVHERAVDCSADADAPGCSTPAAQ